MATVQPPPMPKSKRRNAVLRLYDAPLYRDWAFWLTAANTALGGFSMVASDQPSTLPLWLDVILGIVMLGGLFGVLPAWLRLLVRRWRWRRRARQATTPRQQPPHAIHRWRQPVPNQPTAPLLALRPPAYQSPVPPATPAPPPHRFTTHPEVVDSPTEPPSGVLVVARNSLPHPTARAVRALEQAHTARDRYEAILNAAETLAITLSVTAAALLNGRPPQVDGSQAGQRELSALRSAYLSSGGVTFGSWTNWLANLGALANTQPDLIPGLRDAMADRPASPGLLAHLNLLREERNRSAHGNRPHNRQEFDLRVAVLEPHLEAALSRARFLEEIPWLLTVSSSFLPRQRLFKVVARRAMGDHPDFETRTFDWATPVADEMFYVLGPSGPLTLSPFVASRFCSHCQQLEVCYAYKADRRHGPATFKSFDSGHDIPAEELGDDLRSLPDRNQTR